jgi:hypothetical protein
MYEAVATKSPPSATSTLSLASDASMRRHRSSGSTVGWPSTSGGAAFSALLAMSSSRAVSAARSLVSHSARSTPPSARRAWASACRNRPASPVTAICGLRFLNISSSLRLAAT